ncbi:MAG: N-carbamoylputrescine amidase [Chthoniobacterales bacterium]|nr:N-carbamoylputrescine amidase [Chthoniobacterales bacterium]
MRNVTVAATQMACGRDRGQNLERAEALVRRAAGQGANVILVQELFETPYFCQDQLPEYFELARPAVGNEGIARFQALARELDVALPFSFFERANQAYFNSVAMIDAGGEFLGIYRKTHIPDGPGYQEKYYFNPGDTGFRVWDTKFGKIGVGICWDQWFPETARCMVLGGAELLLYPTAIGSEPQYPDWDTAEHWQRVMQGHAAANMVPLVASNRIGTEEGRNSEMTFFGSSFITDETGKKVAEAGRTDEAVLVRTFDLDAIRNLRAQWGFFRDRRPDHYQALVTMAGEAARS